MKPTATKSARSSRSAKRSEWGDRNEPARSECRAKLNNMGVTLGRSIARKGRSPSTRGHKRIRKIKQQSLRDRTASSHRQGTRHNSLDLRESLADISHLNPFDHHACSPDASATRLTRTQRQTPATRRRPSNCGRSGAIPRQPMQEGQQIRVLPLPVAHGEVHWRPLAPHEGTPPYEAGCTPRR
jgi:hypothetical protein